MEGSSSTRCDIFLISVDRCSLKWMYIYVLCDIIITVIVSIIWTFTVTVPGYNGHTLRTLVFWYFIRDSCERGMESLWHTRVSSGWATIPYQGLVWKGNGITLTYTCIQWVSHDTLSVTRVKGEWNHSDIHVYPVGEPRYLRYGEGS